MDRAITTPVGYQTIEALKRLWQATYQYDQLCVHGKRPRHCRVNHGHHGEYRLNLRGDLHWSERIQRRR